MDEAESIRKLILTHLPTDEQREAIFSVSPEFLLRAAPGSGKTWTSSRRFIWRGVNWEHAIGGLALLSFTNAAIGEFTEAATALGKGDLLGEPNFVGTFDSFIERFILSGFGHLGARSLSRPVLFAVPQTSHKDDSSLKGWIKTQNGRNIPVPAWEIVPSREDRKTVFRASEINGNPVVPNGKSAVHALFGRGRYTHSQRAYLVYCTLSARPDIAGLVARCFPEILVDEAQDTNIWLLILLNILRKQGAKISLIGDPNQCIYEFAMADPKSLGKLRDHWEIEEKRLTKSFRCNSSIANAANNFSIDGSISGFGKEDDPLRRPFVVRVENSQGYLASINDFQKLLAAAGLDSKQCAILCRARKDLRATVGIVRYSSLKGRTEEMADAAFQRDIMNDTDRAFEIVKQVIRQVTRDSDFSDGDEDIPAEEMLPLPAQLAIWTFVRHPDGLPSLNLTGKEWTVALRASTDRLLAQLGINERVRASNFIKSTGLDNDQLSSPLFERTGSGSSLRRETIHQVKGESLDGVMLMGSARFFDSVVDAANRRQSVEALRLAYVAMTRARHVLVVALPATHFDRHVNQWRTWGFLT